MKTERGKRLVLVLVVLVLIACAFAVGASWGQRTMLARMTPELNGVQAMLAFNRLQDERHMQSLISQGCTEGAANFLDYARDKDMELLAGFVKGNIDDGTLKYITDRDASLLGDLRAFKSKYGSSWFEKACKPS